MALWWRGDRFTDSEGYFVLETSVYRLLKAHDLIASPAFIVMKAAEEFTGKTTAPNQLWQTDFAYLKVIGWGGSTCRQFSVTSKKTCQSRLTLNPARS